MAQVTLDLPEELSSAISSGRSDLQRAAFEAIALEAFRERRLSAAQLRRILGFETRDQLDTFLKGREVWQDFSVEEFERQFSIADKLV